jgi:hypothetical protein
MMFFLFISAQDCVNGEIIKDGVEVEWKIEES